MYAVKPTSRIPAGAVVSMIHEHKALIQPAASTNGKLSSPPTVIEAFSTTSLAGAFALNM